MESSVIARHAYRFGLFLLDPEGGELLRQGVPVKLQEQPFRVLCLLVERPGEIVTREELRRLLWPEGTYVEFDGSLNATLKRLRSALGDPADNPVFIETLPKRGYRFIAPIELLPSPPSEDGEFAAPPAATPSGRGKYIWGIAAVLVVLGVLTFLYRYRPKPVHVAESQPPRVVAVLPFGNEQGSPDLDFLRFAIPEDIVTDLTYARSLSVRPFATTSKYAAQAVDPVAVGRDLKVTHLLSGEFVREHKNLQITLELIEAASDRALWRKTVTVDSNNFIAMHRQVEDLVRSEVMAALGVAAPSVGEVPAPQNARAFDSYLRSVSVSRDPVPNKLAIKSLEEAVSLDSSYAPAWTELGWRYYIDGHYGDGGPAAMARGEQANQRAIDLAPNGVTNLVTLKTERGDLKGAYDEAHRLLQRRPDASAAHFEMSYVLRYAGLLQEAGEECDRALRIDPGYYLFRSCALAFIFRGDYARAQEYVRLDESSGFGIKSKLYIALRQKQYPEASLLASKISNAGFPWVELMAAQLAGRPDADLAVISSQQEQSFKAPRDTEDMYETATALGFANQSAAAIRILRLAIAHGYCSYPAIDNDPLFDSVRKQPGFQELRQKAIACQQDFLAERRKIDADPAAHP